MTYFLVFCLFRTVPLFALRAAFLPVPNLVEPVLVARALPEVCFGEEDSPELDFVRFTDFWVVLRGGRFGASLRRMPSNGFAANFVLITMGVP